MARTWKFYFKDKKELEKFIKEGPSEDFPAKVQQALENVSENPTIELSIDESTGEYTQSTASKMNKAGTYEVE